MGDAERKLNREDAKRSAKKNDELYLAGFGLQFGQMLGRADQAVPVGLDVLRRAADLGDDLGHLLRSAPFRSRPRGKPSARRGSSSCPECGRTLRSPRSAPDRSRTSSAGFGTGRTAGLLKMQSTGQTSRHASQPVQLSALMTANSLGSFLRGPSLAIYHEDAKIAGSMLCDSDSIPTTQS